MEVKFEFLRSISCGSLEKRFMTKNILERCSISDKNRALIKKIIMNEFSILIEEKITESDLELINKTKSS